MNNTYSFQDVACAFAHPACGQLILQGEGVGSITFTQAADVTAHDRAADGRVMVSKIVVKDGSFVINIQQDSDAQSWLTRYYNYIMAAPPEEFALATLTLTSKNMVVTHDARGVSPQKRGDKGYEATGKQVAWTFMARELTEEAV